MLIMLLVPAAGAQAGTAVFAGGSFWVMEALFSGRPGIAGVEPGWMQGDIRQPRWQVVRVTYDQSKLTYGDLLNMYWQAVDSRDAKGQFCDRGQEYSPAIFVQGSLQLKWARQSRARLWLEQNEPLAVRILPVGRFEPAAQRHHQFARQHPWLFFAYRSVCGYANGNGVSMQPWSAAVPATTE
ncbi:peptide-methionine (S)-S-oxide reductase [Oceanimonas smirnovii]|uniref:peptide-methionine (S)-S-oxide reductase n=2 Tax=Oceanimonas smirnovii TaxID=264574 RepID=A0ABW7NXF9_9GAMM